MAKKTGPAASGKGAADPASVGRLKQIGMVAGILRKSNPKALPIVFGIVIGVIALFVVLGLVVGLGPLFIPLGVLLGVMGGMIAFGRFAQGAQYAAIEGQPGAAAAILQSMRGNWTVTPAIAANRNMDVVHRTVGRPGVVLVGEGVPARVSQLLAAERKKTERVAHGVPIHEFQVGNGEGQVRIGKLQRKITTLPRTLRPTAVADLNYRLKALQPTMQMPKGPMPKGVRQPRMPKPR